MVSEYLESQKFQDFTSDSIDVYTAKFQSFNKTGLVLSGIGDLSFFFPWQRFKSVLIFQFNGFIIKGVRKNQNLISWAYPWAVGVHQSSILAFEMKENLVWIHISPRSHRTALWPFRIAPLHKPQSALQSVQYQGLTTDSSSNNRFSSILGHDMWKRFSQSPHSTHFSEALPYVSANAAAMPWTRVSFDVPGQDQKNH